jgi:adenylate cyclase 10
MKVASVIGDIFDVQTLYKIQPLKDEISYEKILKLLRTLDDKNIIELMEVNDVNIYYRFTCPFMRECIYQTMIFTQRRELHRNVAQAIQELPSEYEVD